MSNEIRNSIIQHLLNNKDHIDDIEGISLFVYNKEIKNLSDEILAEILELISNGLVVEREDFPDKKYYQLSDNKSLLRNFQIKTK